MGKVRAVTGALVVLTSAVGAVVAVKYARRIREEPSPVPAGPGPVRGHKPIGPRPVDWQEPVEPGPQDDQESATSADLLAEQPPADRSRAVHEQLSPEAVPPEQRPPEPVPPEPWHGDTDVRHEPVGQAWAGMARPKPPAQPTDRPLMPAVRVYQELGRHPVNRWQSSFTAASRRASLGTSPTRSSPNETSPRTRWYDPSINPILHEYLERQVRP